MNTNTQRILRVQQEVRAKIDRIALEESIKLMAHYAELCNRYDGGVRRIFKTADEWIARLQETGTLSRRLKEL